MDNPSEMQRVTLPKLNASNYFLWPNKMEVLLRGRGLWYFIDEAQRDSASIDEGQAYALKKDQAIALLLMCIEYDCIAPVISLRDPTKIWITLDDMFKATSAAMVDAYVAQYQKLKMRPSEKVMQYVNRMKELQNKLTAVGHTVDNAEKKRILLRGLRAEFAVTVGVIRATEKSVQDSVGLLVIHEAEGTVSKVNAPAKLEQAFPVTNSGRNKECYYCGKKGHIKVNCFRNPKSKLYTGIKSDEKVGKDDGAGKESLISFLASVSESCERFAEKWFVDSGALAHMCNSESAFTDFYKNCSGRKVSIGNGSPLAIKGEGSVQALTAVDEKTQDVALKGVLFVPELFCNLISVSACRKNNLKVTFDSTKDGHGLCVAEQSPTSGKVFLAVESIENGLFEAILRSKNTMKRQALVAERDISELWHMRMGHASVSTIKRQYQSCMG